MLVRFIALAFIVANDAVWVQVSKCAYRTLGRLE